MGAYRGDILRVFLQHATNGFVIGFEPDPDNCVFLKKRFPSAQIEQFALGGTVGLQDFIRNTARPARSHLATLADTSMKSKVSTERVQVSVTTLDNYFSKSEVVDFIKIDAEGAELEILKGGMSVFCRSQPLMIIEHGLDTNTFSVDKSKEIFEIIQIEIGLDIFPLNDIREPISSSDAFLELLATGIDYFFAAPNT